MTDIRSIATSLAARGAVLTVPGEPPLHFIVGDFAWLDEHRVFWFTANGETEFDGHVLEFDAAQSPHALGVEFWRAGKLVGYLTTIDEADLDDPGAAAGDWLSWQAIVANKTAFIDGVRARLEEG